ncbi:hypothetical protein I6F48_00395 [Pseudoalteromonas sp. SWYJ118]|uniref:LA2681 family HEPN domain-containing protein n=1 Tax=Pseudoalteromonas sp. SWYJ118 TaxID=2792062 RepID=UPI0018CDFF3D|nr:LA2681 family HEPN domain-containing protein [Pseudoalteromonas sp. SWYJ118]MBH0074023.1 hypothetical protein [Pseudoalteromonas sp. SWYJ118]
MEDDTKLVLIDNSAMALFEARADELILSGNKEELASFVKAIDQKTFTFDDYFLEARYFYTLANCYSDVYRYRDSDWYSEDLSKAVVNFRKALYAIKHIEDPNVIQLNLRSRIETNLANYLSSQGRAICALEHWNNALDINDNPVAIIAKINNAFFIAECLYDKFHSHYHYFEAYKLICLGFESLNNLEEEHQKAYSEDGKFLKFKLWFETEFQEYDFSLIDNYKEDFKSKKQKDYLRWCGAHRLFLNDLNDLYKTELTYTDCFTLPTITQSINRTLTYNEDLIYHGNFDEIKNDYCYSRYLIFSSLNISNEQEHFFNGTYDRVDDMTHSLTNLKSQHYKTAFKTLYSIFDKIAYFLNSFYDLNKIDSKIYFHNIFGQIKNGKLKPHKKLIDSQNYFLHALFFILKDIRNSNSKELEAESESYWLDPDIEAFSEIRNAMEHRSLKIVDAFGHTLTKSSIEFHQRYVDELIEKKITIQHELECIYPKIKQAKKAGDLNTKAKLDLEKNKLDSALNKLEIKLTDKEKRSKHSLLITDEEFELRLFTLMKLVRNSIMYLSLAINHDEMCKPANDYTSLEMNVPLKV